MLQAYNDWHVDEWCGTHPGRFIPLSIPPIWDPQLMADEVRRVAKKGCHAVTFSENPEKLGFPSFHSDALGPVLAGVSATRARSCACTSGRRRSSRSRRVEAPINVMITLQPMNIVQAAADLLWSRVLTEFPDVRSRCPRAASAGSRTSSSASTTSTSTTRRGPDQDLGGSSRASSSASGSSPASSTTRRASRSATASASTGSRGSATTRTRTRRGPTHPSGCTARSSACPTPRSTPSRTRTRCGCSTTTRSA